MLIGQRENRLAIDDEQLESDFISIVGKSRPFQESTVNLVSERGHITCLAGAIRKGEGGARKIVRKKGVLGRGENLGRSSLSPGPLSRYPLPLPDYACYAG